MKNTYNDQQYEKLHIKLNDLLSLLPDFTEYFFRGISDTTQIKTRIAYAYDLRIFFYYLYNKSGQFNQLVSEKDFTVQMLDDITPIEIEKFSEFLNLYKMPNYKNPDVMITYKNSPPGKMRKLSTLRSFYKYYYKKQLIKTNPTLLVDLPRLTEKPIIRLDSNESKNLLYLVEKGEKLSTSQKKYHKINSKRDLAIIYLLLGTGIRISECVGLNISDFDFDNNSFLVTRKGGDQTILYLPEEVSEILRNYIKEYRSKQIVIVPDDVDAMFLSMQKKRLTSSSIEKMVKKYSQIIIPLKNISPHKFRSTFGTNLYAQTDDIYLVADVLGHKDVNTTKKHYAAISEQKRKIAAELTKLK